MPGNDGVEVRIIFDKELTVMQMFIFFCLYDQHMNINEAVNEIRLQNINNKDFIYIYIYTYIYIYMYIYIYIYIYTKVLMITILQTLFYEQTENTEYQ